jgi:hypothetical protein
MPSNLKTALLVIGSLIGLAIVALVIWLATSPEPGVKLANEMDEYALTYLDEHNLVNADERLVAYYDVTMSMNGTEAAILTTKRVVYHKRPRTTVIPLEEVVDLQHSYESMIGDVIVVKSGSGESMKIEIAPFNGGEAFYGALQNAWESARPAEVPEAQPTEE